MTSPHCREAESIGRESEWRIGRATATQQQRTLFLTEILCMYFVKETGLQSTEKTA